MLEDLVQADTSPFVIDFGLATVTWRWNGDAYDRTRGSFAHRDAYAQRVRATNVIVLETSYSVSRLTGSPIAESVGAGNGFVLVDGRSIAVSWNRGSSTDPYRLTQSDTGAEILLAPGSTWIELIPTGLRPFAD